MEAKKEDKYFVLKQSDLEEFFKPYIVHKGIFDELKGKGKVVGDALDILREDIRAKRKLQGKIDNKYIVCNQDEPYADLVWQIILYGEDAKREECLKEDK